MRPLKGKLRGMSESIRTAFRQQAAFCRASGSALTGAVLEALADTLDVSTRTGRRILEWPGDPMVDALKLRIAGGLNALARSGREPELTKLYDARTGEFHAVLKRVFEKWDDWLYPWLDGPPQTNEVARAAVLWPGMLEIARRFGPKMEWIEIGSSGGLNLNMDRFGYQLGATRSGDPMSALQLSPGWEGASPRDTPIEVVDRVGIDMQPLDMSDPVIAERMLAYIWPDQTERVARAQTAIIIARAWPPPIVKGDAAEFLVPLLAEPQDAGRTRVVFHSIMLQYLPPEARARVRQTIEAAGARATAERPLAWLSMEFQDKVPTAELRLRCWPGTEAEETLAHVHPHGAQLIWVAENG